MVSNKALTFFLVLTILVSVFGTFLLINGISGFSYTGFATSGASATSLTVTGAAAVSVAPTSLDFGSVKVTSGFDGANCTFQSGGEALAEDNGGCATVPTNPGFINITNIGSSSLNISINASANATVFLGNFTGTPVTEPLFQMNVTDTYFVGSCGLGLSGPEFANLLPLNASKEGDPAVTICQYLQSNASFNRLNVGLRIALPVESQPTSKAATINVFAVEG